MTKITTESEYTRKKTEEYLTEIKIETNKQFNDMLKLIDENRSDLSYDISKNCESIIHLLNLIEDQNRVNKELFTMIAILACVLCCLIAYIVIRFGGI